MKIDLKNLPTDVEMLHKIIIDLVGELLCKKNELYLLKKQYYGSSSEKVKQKIDDLENQIEESEQEISKLALTFNNDKDETQSSDSKSANKPKRKTLPDDLPREQVTLNPESICPSCGGENFRLIDNDVSEVLEYQPASFKVIQTIRPRCACINCEKVIQAAPNWGPIDKCKAGPGLLAHIIVQKYCNHLPLYRQSQIMQRDGIEISRSTMASWVGQCSNALEPLIEKLKQEVFQSSHIHGDDTPIKVLAPGANKTKTGRLWTYVRDGRASGDNTPPAVCYFYEENRRGEKPFNHLTKFDFKGVFHADAYPGYDQLYKIKNDDGSLKITEAACLAHTRRKFYEVTLISNAAEVAFKSVEEIGKIYAIESEIRGESPEVRKQIRQQKTKPIITSLFDWWQKVLKALPQKGDTAKAIHYALNNKQALMRFLDDGRIEVDNNAAERAMRCVALGRKNWLFAGSDQGGVFAANMYSLIETAKLNNINPHKYLVYVLSNIQDHKLSKIHELLPWNVKIE